MKKNWKRIASLFLSVLLLLSMTVTPVMAAEGKAAPTEVKSCTVTGFMPEYMALEFEDTYNYNRQDQDTQKRPHKSSHLANPFFFHCPFPPLKNRYFLLHTAGNLPLFFVCF